MDELKRPPHRGRGRAPDERTNERTKRRHASLRWEKSVGVGPNKRFGPHRKVFIFVEAKERQDGKIFPLGKRGDYKEISLSSTIDDDGCAVASRHVTTRTTPRAAFFLLPLFSLSLFVFCFFHSPSFLYLVVRTSQTRIGVERYAFVCYLKIIASLLLLF